MRSTWRLKHFEQGPCCGLELKLHLKEAAKEIKKVGQKLRSCVSGGEITTIELRDFSFKDCFFLYKKVN